MFDFCKGEKTNMNKDKDNLNFETVSELLASLPKADKVTTYYCSGESDLSFESLDEFVQVVLRGGEVNHNAHIRTRLKRPINGAFRLVVAHRRQPYVFLRTENPSLLRSFQVAEFWR